MVTVVMPPLRERGDDVLFLAKHILAELGHADAIEIEGDVAEALVAYSWPGNVRELRNAIERAIHLGAAHAIPMVAGQPLPKSGEQPAIGQAKRAASEASGDFGRAGPEDREAPDLPFKQAKEQIVVAFEHAYVRRLMDRHEGNISAAARDAGIDRNYLYRLLKKHGLEH